MLLNNRVNTCYKYRKNADLAVLWKLLTVNEAEAEISAYCCEQNESGVDGIPREIK